MRRVLIGLALAAATYPAVNRNYGRLPHPAQAILCRLRFGPASRCPHIIPGGQWSGR